MDAICSLIFKTRLFLDEGDEYSWSFRTGFIGLKLEDLIHLFLSIRPHMLMIS